MLTSNHHSDPLTLFFVPDDWAQTLSFRGNAILYLLAATQVLSLVATRRPTADHLDHLIGMLVGYGAAKWWQSNGQKKEKPENSVELGWWWDTLLGKDKETKKEEGDR